MARKMFVNLAVRDLGKSMDFFASLGFTFNKQFTDNNAACLVLGDDNYAMLLTEPFFKTFTKRELCDPARQIEALIALSCESRGEVDELLKKALAAGGTPAAEPQDHGFMYSRAFLDVDGHQWEPFWMDPAQVQG
jgi:predicted lactoylglutathione lyase